MPQKTAYVCGPLTELSPEVAQNAKIFYERIADVCQGIMGVRAFVPHEHYDPIKHAHFTPEQVDRAERDQIFQRTSLLIVVPIAPSWGGGIEVEMANWRNISAIILVEKGKKISRLLKGNPAVEEIIEYEDEDEGILVLEKAIIDLFQSKKQLAEVPF